MFKVDECIRNTSFAIRNGKNYLHSDGSIFETGEYFPTKECAQDVLDKFQPEPKHEWVHGDVFKRPDGIWIYIVNNAERVQIFCFSGWNYCLGTHDPAYYMKTAKFLFNIKEKL